MWWLIYREYNFDQYTLSVEVNMFICTSKQNHFWSVRTGGMTYYLYYWIMCTISDIWVKGIGFSMLYLNIWMACFKEFNQILYTI